MSLIGRKKDIFTTISSIKSFNENDRKVRTNDSLSSLTNKKDSLSFLLDLISILIGSGGFIKLIGGLFSNVFDEAQPLIKIQILNNLTTPLSNKELNTTPFNTGILLPVSYIDVFNKLKTDPSTDIGNLIYNNSTIDFDYDLYDAINNPNVDKIIGNIIVKYIQVTDEFLIRAVDLNQTVFEFNEEYMNDNIVHKNEFITNVIDNIFGIKTSSQNKSLNQITKELILKAKIEKINNEEDVLISPNELDNIETSSKQIKDGVNNIDLGCGIYQSSITINNLTDLINNVQDSDVNTVSNEFSNLFDESFEIDNNSDTAKDNFSRKIINGFELELTKSFFLNPKSLILNYINQKIVDGEINNNTENIIENNKKTIGCISGKTKEVVNKFIFNLVKSELNNLIKPFVKMIIKEKINQYSGILRSLTGFS